MSMSLPPGFRFNPTDEELVFYYLRNRAASVQCPVLVIADVDIYKFDPWDLPSQAVYGEREWYFFSPRDRKYPNGNRPNRAAGSGYWKSIGTDKAVDGGAVGEGVGVKKALSFYTGRAPRGTKTSWVMHEYRLTTEPLGTHKPIKFRDVSMRLDDWVLCRIYEKTNNASQMVPPLTLADYDHTANHDDLYGGGGFNNAPGLFAPSSTSCTCKTVIAQQQQIGGDAHTGGAPEDPSISELFDKYAATHIFSTEAEHLALHPSLNQLLSGCDSTHVEPSYYARPSSSRATSGGAGKAASPGDQCCGAAGRIVIDRPPVVVQDTQRVIPGRGAAAVVAERLASGGGAACAQPSDASSYMQLCMHNDTNENETIL